MTLLVRNDIAVQEIETKLKEGISITEKEPSPDTLDVLNNYLESLGVFFKQIFITTPDGQYTAPAPVIVTRSVFVSSYSYKKSDIDNYFHRTRNFLESIRSNLSFVRVIAQTDTRRPEIGFGRK